MGAYTHLTAEERGLIMAEHQRGSTGAAVARLLGRSRSTVTRELRRNGTAGGVYVARTAAQAYRERRRRCVRRRKLVENSWLFAHVRDRLLYRWWSPQQIAATLSRMDPDDPTPTGQPRDHLRGDLRTSQGLAAPGDGPGAAPGQV